ncbi:TIGR02530 family flagellar biosynthesis protein [Gracilibacillus alcaliphilus]|uniref:TIGR02530 family flagellar biosynthesis protein n=1 Tax=Gracilibacillus alcaliphilus TaxID=1401441 RepID=UPI00195CE28F|nr:TIGR02530 family flagellar biosynthesis protein [Gracilibacillus alcaliphilus]MBM7677939.1 flagellar operon protein [Gracilibacillus alcaliphilus]
MENRIHAYHPPIIASPKPAAKPQPVASSFAKVLKSEQSITISKHANERLRTRNIAISEDKWFQMEQKLEEAKQKGVKESLVLLDNAGLIVNAQNKTVITALDKQEMNSKIFTNINGTILLD